MTAAGPTARPVALELRVRSEAGAAVAVEISVRDTGIGIGIPPARPERRWASCDSREDRRAGTFSLAEVT
jgi:signal transduction histidine kinase